MIVLLHTPEQGESGGFLATCMVRATPEQIKGLEPRSRMCSERKDTLLLVPNRKCFGGLAIMAAFLAMATRGVDSAKPAILKKR